jgi:outer membrane protein TolC
MLGRENEAEFELVDDVPFHEPPANPNFQSLVASTPDHLQAVAQEDSAVAGVVLARSGFYPTLGLSASSSKLGKDWFPQYDRWSVGATLSIPIFTGGRDYYGTQSAIATHTAASATRLSGDRQLIAKLKQAYVTYVEASEKLKVDQSFHEAELKRAEIGRSKYNNGLLTFEEWDLIENDLIVRERAVLQSQRDRTTAESAWFQALGKGASL